MENQFHRSWGALKIILFIGEHHDQIIQVMVAAWKDGLETSVPRDSNKRELGCYGTRPMKDES